MSCWAPADVSIPQCFTRLCFASFSLLCVSIKLHLSHVPSTTETKLSLQGGPQARSAECQVGTSWGWLCLSSAFLQLHSPWHLLVALLTTSCTASPISRQLNINVYNYLPMTSLCRYDKCQEFQLKNLVKMRDRIIVQSSVCVVFPKKSTGFTIGGFGGRREASWCSPLSLTPWLSGSLTPWRRRQRCFQFQLQTCGCIGRRVWHSDRHQSLFPVQL